MCRNCHSSSSTSYVNLSLANPVNLIGVKKSAMLARVPVNLHNLEDGHPMCDNTEGNMRDSYGDDCDWYTAYPDSCGVFDTASFSSHFACCACGGGHSIGCEDSANGATDTWGDHCDWYSENLGMCGDFDDGDFSASSMCCACTGGTTVWNLAQAPQPISLTAANKVRPVVAARKQTMLARRPANLQNLDDGHDWCDNTNYSYRDITGDDCSWYDSFPDTCGNYDYNGFEANSQCCSCGGGYNQVCEDTSLDFKDGFGDSCDWYAGNEDWCGGFDDDDFSANSMCCTCGGGTGPWANLAVRTPMTLATTNPMNLFNAKKSVMLQSAPAVVSLSSWCRDSNGWNTDITGDGCEWYDAYPSTCGQYDAAGFSANSMCCSCNGGSVCSDST